MSQIKCSLKNNHRKKSSPTYPQEQDFCRGSDCHTWQFENKKSNKRRTAALMWWWVCGWMDGWLAGWLTRVVEQEGRKGAASGGELAAFLLDPRSGPLKLETVRSHNCLLYGSGRVVSNI